jgi:hypothetical protein
MLRVISAFIPHGLVIKPWTFSTNSLYFTTQSFLSLKQTTNLYQLLTFMWTNIGNVIRNCGTVGN